MGIRHALLMVIILAATNVVAQTNFVERYNVSFLDLK